MKKLFHIGDSLILAKSPREAYTFYEEILKKKQNDTKYTTEFQSNRNNGSKRIRNIQC